MVPRQETGGAVELGLVRPHRAGKITIGRGHGDVTRHTWSAIRNDHAHFKCSGRERTKTQHVSSFSLGAYLRWKGSIFCPRGRHATKSAGMEAVIFQIPRLDISPVSPHLWR